MYKRTRLGMLVYVDRRRASREILAALRSRTLQDAARVLGCSPQTLRRWMRILGLARES